MCLHEYYCALLCTTNGSVERRRGMCVCIEMRIVNTEPNEIVTDLTNTNTTHTHVRSHLFSVPYLFTHGLTWKAFFLARKTNFFAASKYDDDIVEAA